MKSTFSLWIQAVFAFCALFGVSSTADARNESFRVDRQIRNGGYYDIDIPRGRVQEIEVQLRRINPKDTDTKVEVRLDGNTTLGPAQQVDSQEIHSLRFSGEGLQSKDGELRLNIRNGDVYIKRVFVDIEGGRGRHNGRSRSGFRGDRERDDYERRDRDDRESRYRGRYDDRHFGRDWRENDDYRDRW